MFQINQHKINQLVDELKLKYINKMEYQKIIYLLENTSTQLSKFRTKNWVERNDNKNGTYYKKTIGADAAVIAADRNYK